MKTANGRTVTGHAHRADRLLIRPASGRQAGTGLFARTYHWKDIHTRSHSQIESRTKSTDTNLTNAPDGTPTDSQFTNDPRSSRWSVRTSSCSAPGLVREGADGLGRATLPFE